MIVEYLATDEDGRKYLFVCKDEWNLPYPFDGHVLLGVIPDDLEWRDIEFLDLSPLNTTEGIQYRITRGGPVS